MTDRLDDACCLCGRPSEWVLAEGKLCGQCRAFYCTLLDARNAAERTAARAERRAADAEALAKTAEEHLRLKLETGVPVLEIGDRVAAYSISGTVLAVRIGRHREVSYLVRYWDGCSPQERWFSEDEVRSEHTLQERAT